MKRRRSPSKPLLKIMRDEYPEMEELPHPIPGMEEVLAWAKRLAAERWGPKEAIGRILMTAEDGMVVAIQMPSAELTAAIEANRKKSGT